MFRTNSSMSSRSLPLSLFNVCILGAEVYELLHRHRQEDKSRRKMLDDILVHIQVISGEVSIFFEFFFVV